MCFVVVVVVGVLVVEVEGLESQEAMVSRSQEVAPEEVAMISGPGDLGFVVVVLVLVAYSHSHSHSR